MGKVYCNCRQYTQQRAIIQPYGGTLVPPNTLILAQIMCLCQKWSVEGDQSDVKLISKSETHFDVRSWFLFCNHFNHKITH